MSSCVVALLNFANLESYVISLNREIYLNFILESYEIIYNQGRKSRQ